MYFRFLPAIIEQKSAGTVENNNSTENNGQTKKQSIAEESGNRFFRSLESNIDLEKGLEYAKTQTKESGSHTIPNQTQDKINLLNPNSLQNVVKKTENKQKHLNDRHLVNNRDNNISRELMEGINTGNLSTKTDGVELANKLLFNKNVSLKNISTQAVLKNLFNNNLNFQDKELYKQLNDALKKEIPVFREMNNGNEKILFLFKNKELVLETIKGTNIPSVMKERVLDKLETILTDKDAATKELLNSLKEIKLNSNEEKTNGKFDIENAILNSGKITADGIMPRYEVKVNKVGKAELMEWVTQLKKEIYQLKEFRIDSPYKVQMLLREGEEYLRFTVTKSNEVISVNVSGNGEEMKEKAEFILRDIRSDMRERNIEIKIEMKQNEQSEKQKEQEENKNRERREQPMDSSESEEEENGFYK